MKESKILRAIKNPSWYAHAYSEYLADVAQSMSDLKLAVERSIMDEEVMVADVLSELDINPLARYIIPNGKVCLIQDLCTNIRGFYNDELSEEETGFDMSVDEIIASLNLVYSQTIISSKAFSSFSLFPDDIKARVTTFLEDVSTAIGDVKSDVREVLNYYREMVQVSPRVEDFVDQYLINTGVEDIITSDDPLSYVNSNAAEITGNTPGVALDFATTRKVVGATCAMAGQAIKSVFNLAKSGLEWAFSKARKYVNDTLIDPAIAEFVDSDVNDGYIDGYAYFGTFIPSKTYSILESDGELNSLLSRQGDKYKGNWIKIKSCLGEVLFKPNHPNPHEWSAYFKPVAIDMQYLLDNVDHAALIFPATPPEPAGMDSYYQWIEGIAPFIRPLSKNATAEQLVWGYSYSQWLFRKTSALALFEVGSRLSVNPAKMPYMNFSPTYNQPTFNATNLMLLQSVAGNVNNLKCFCHYDAVAGVSVEDSIPEEAIETAIVNLICCWAISRDDREYNPTDYWFFPFSNNHSGFTNPSWRIKTDAEIASTRDNFLSAIIIAVVAVAAITFIGVSVKKISTRLKFRKKAFLGQMDNKLWNGEKLSSSEMRRYSRYSRKLDAIESLNPNSIFGAPRTDGLIAQLYSLITG